MGIVGKTGPEVTGAASAGSGGNIGMTFSRDGPGAETGEVLLTSCGAVGRTGNGAGPEAAGKTCQGGAGDDSGGRAAGFRTE